MEKPRAHPWDFSCSLYDKSLCRFLNMFYSSQETREAGQRKSAHNTCTIVMEKERAHVLSMSTIAPKKTSRKPIKVQSFTRDEIDRYWRMRRMIEEDHLLFAEKAAARIRAKALREEDHRRFEELLKEMLEEEGVEEKTAGGGGGGGGNKEQCVGIKDWWTKSKYAYLNQPAIKSMGESSKPKGQDTYIPQKTCLYLFPDMGYFCATSFGVH
ncbi:hypothetical protein Cni_G18470 [Canna indica]|uniref:Uncharacterized protein n=1 Tax=Canna indica TaxID=4628 RepID=A0AAQ3KJB5_9LILI|nr:hypothetical protein Cni_G18470 [Canna indica]